MSSLARLGLLKTMLGLSGNLQDETLKQLLKAATAQAEEFTHRQLVSATITDEAHIGSGNKMLYPHEFPVSAPTAVGIWNGTEYEAETASYVEVLKGRSLHYPTLLQKDNSLHQLWPSGYDKSGDGNDLYNIHITYVAGYVTTDWDTETVKLVLSSLTTVPLAADTLTQANTGATITVTGASAADNTITGTLASGLLRDTKLSADTFTSDDAGANTMAPTPVSATKIINVHSSPGSFAVPADLEQAVATIAAMLWLETRESGEGRLGKTGQVAADLVVTYERFEKGIPPEAMMILKQYMR